MAARPQGGQGEPFQNMCALQCWPPAGLMRYPQLPGVLRQGQITSSQNLAMNCHINTAPCTLGCRALEAGPPA